MEFYEFRNKIDKIDDQISMLLVERRNVCKQIGSEKKLKCMPTENLLREQEILCRITKNLDADVVPYIEKIYGKIFETSKEYQNQIKEK